MKSEARELYSDLFKCDNDDINDAVRFRVSDFFRSSLAGARETAVGRSTLTFAEWRLDIWRSDERAPLPWDNRGRP